MKRNRQSPSFTKIAMKNMVYQAKKSGLHFFLTFVGLLFLFIGIV